MTSRIPEARNQLWDIAERLTAMGHVGMANEIKQIVEEYMKRHRVKKPAPRTARSMTPELAMEILHYHEAHPFMSNRAIGAKFGVDGARVSEVITGAKWLPQQEGVPASNVEGGEATTHG